MLAWLPSRNANILNKLYALTLAGTCLPNGKMQEHFKPIGRSLAINVWNKLHSLLHSKGIGKPGFFKQS